MEPLQGVVGVGGHGAVAVAYASAVAEAVVEQAVDVVVGDAVFHTHDSRHLFDGMRLFGMVIVCATVVHLFITTTFCRSDYCYETM